jgi:hypothetical protein
MSILGQDRKYEDPLTEEQRLHAWQTAYVFSLDLHANEEIVWEVERWRELNAPGIAGLGEALLQERRSHGFEIPAESNHVDLTLLWRRVPQSDVLRWVRSGALCLLAALRLVYWLGSSAEELAA